VAIRKSSNHFTGLASGCLAPFGINLLYTLGWLVEAPARLLKPSLSPSFGPLLLKLGLGLGLFLITLPAAFWGGYRLLQMAGVL
jgi:hypothetical protein